MSRSESAPPGSNAPSVQAALPFTSVFTTALRSSAGTPVIPPPPQPQPVPVIQPQPQHSPLTMLPMFNPPPPPTRPPPVPTPAAQSSVYFAHRGATRFTPVPVQQIDEMQRQWQGWQEAFPAHGAYIPPPSNVDPNERRLRLIEANLGAHNAMFDVWENDSINAMESAHRVGKAEEKAQLAARTLAMANVYQIPTQRPHLMETYPHQFSNPSLPYNPATSPHQATFVPPAPQNQMDPAVRAYLEANFPHLLQTPPLPPLAPALPGTTPITTTRKKSATPTKFAGIRKLHRVFLQQCNLYINNNRAAFTDDNDKIGWACGYLEGEAATWAEPLVRSLGQVQYTGEAVRGYVSRTIWGRQHPSQRYQGCRAIAPNRVGCNIHLTL
jgi:hypothetical protein